MFGLRHLLPKQMLGEEAFTSITKKTEEHKKTVQSYMTHIQMIHKTYEDYSIVFGMSLSDLLRDIEPYGEVLPKYYLEFIHFFKSISHEIGNNVKIQSESDQSIQSTHNNLTNDFDSLMKSLKLKLKEYSCSEQSVVEICKRYSKIYKTMMAYMDQYKNSFMDVKLIYNKDEKIKRYNDCLSTYKNLEEDLIAIEHKLLDLNCKKQSCKLQYRNLTNCFHQFLQIMADKFIEELKNIVLMCGEWQKRMMSLTFERKMVFDKIQMTSFFEVLKNIKNEDQFTCAIDVKKCRFIPCLFIHHENIRQENINSFNRQMIYYYEEVAQKIQKKKIINRKMYEFIQKYLKNLDRSFLEPFKDVISNFEKIKKKLSEIFGGRWVAFYKILSSIYESYLLINKRFNEKIENRMKNIDLLMKEEETILEMFNKELKTYIEKVMGKRQMKRYLDKSEKNYGEEQIYQPNTMKQISEQSIFIIHLIEGFIEKCNKSNEAVKVSYNNVISEFRSNATELFNISQQYQFGFQNQEFNGKYQSYKIQIQECLNREMMFFSDTLLGSLCKEKVIVFDSDFQKIEEFKKIKKPKEIEENAKEESNGRIEESLQSRPKSDNFEEKQSIEIEESVDIELESPIRLSTKSKKDSNSIESASKHQISLTKRICYEEGEKYVKSFTCGLNDKIILSGRLYITTQRFFFYSKFNPNNVFFGETFIQVPKEDIKKIEKRSNAVVFDNSLSITTVNGEMFFTSFFSRNDAFDCLCQTFQINTDEQIFEEDKEQLLDQYEQNEKKDAQIQFYTDNITEATAIERQNELNQKLNDFPYQEISQSEFVFPELTAIKLFRLFDADLEFFSGKKNFKNFLFYFRDLEKQKDIEITTWEPNPVQYINMTELKESTPKLFTKKFSSVAPIPGTTLPFMPKVITVNQIHSLYLISKHKYAILSKVSNSGVPYSNTFEIRVKRVMETIDTNKCKMTVFIFINFFENSIAKNIIFTKTTSETKLHYAKVTEEINKHLKVMEKKLKKNQISQFDSKTSLNENSSENQINNDNKDGLDDIDRLEGQNMELSQQNNALKEKIETLQKTASANQKIRLFLILVIVILIYLRM